MALSILDQIDDLHLLTIPGGTSAPKKYRSDKVISYRLLRNNQYIKDVRCPSQTAMEDISLRTLVTAYIYGTWNVKKRENSPMAAIDPMLEMDKDFYKGVWDIITTEVTGAALPEIHFLASFNEIEDLYYDDTVDKFSLKDAQDDYVTYCIMSNIKMTGRGFSRKMDLPVRYLECAPSKGKPDTFRHVLTFFFKCVYFDHKNEVAPVDYWSSNIELSWKFIQKALINDLYTADIFHKEYMREESGY